MSPYVTVSIDPIDEITDPIARHVKRTFVDPYEDIIGFEHSETISLRFAIDQGRLIVRAYGSNDIYLLHEIGHVLTRQFRLWYCYPNTHNFSFNFRDPTTRKGVLALARSEFAAMHVEYAIMAMIGMCPRTEQWQFDQVKRYCEHNFAFLQPDFLGDYELKQAQEDTRVRYDDVLRMWDALADALRIQKEIGDCRARVTEELARSRMVGHAHRSWNTEPEELHG
jgi:hypothetical protein